MSITKNVLLNWYSSIKKRLRKIDYFAYIVSGRFVYLKVVSSTWLSSTKILLSIMHLILLADELELLTLGWMLT